MTGSRAAQLATLAAVAWQQTVLFPRGPYANRSGPAHCGLSLGLCRNDLDEPGLQLCRSFQAFVDFFHRLLRHRDTLAIDFRDLVYCRLDTPVSHASCQPQHLLNRVKDLDLSDSMDRPSTMRGFEWKLSGLPLQGWHGAIEVRSKAETTRSAMLRTQG